MHDFGQRASDAFGKDCSSLEICNNSHRARRSGAITSTHEPSWPRYLCHGISTVCVPITSQIVDCLKVPEVPAELKEWAENTAMGTLAGMLYCGGRQLLENRKEGEHVSACRECTGMQEDVADARRS